MGRRPGQIGLLRFKEADGEQWIDSGEGGVYAYLVAPTCTLDESQEVIESREDDLERCMVETFPTLQHAHLVSSSAHADPQQAEEDYWPDMWKREENKIFGTTYKFRHEIPYGHHIEGKTSDEVRQMTENYLRSYEGGPFYAVVYLGSSGPSVYDDKQELPPLNEPSTFWPIYTREDLTDEGKVLYDTLHKLYGIEPVILLFLDT